MANEKMVYENSPSMPRAGRPFEPRPQPEYDREDQGAVSGKDSDSLTYPSLSSAGRIELELPIRNARGMCKVEKCQARHLGRHIARVVEGAFHSSPAEAVNSLAWYCGVCAGGQLLGDKDQDRMKSLARQFAGAADPSAFFEDEVSPFLHGLTPGRR
jgi:hypothetical protein